MQSSFALPIDLSVKSDNIGFALNAKRSAQGFSNAATRLNTTTAETSAAFKERIPLSLSLWFRI
jgi:hypothetical protein